MDIEDWRKRLLQEKQEIEQLSADGREARGAVELDQQGVGRLSRMDAMQQQAMAVESERRRRIRVKRIEAALLRIERGDFGYCMQCGEEIAQTRLLVDPTSPSCARCAAN